MKLIKLDLSGKTAAEYMAIEEAIMFYASQNPSVPIAFTAKMPNILYSGTKAVLSIVDTDYLDTTSITYARSCVQPCRGSQVIAQDTISMYVFGTAAILNFASIEAFYQTYFVDFLNGLVPCSYTATPIPGVIAAGSGLRLTSFDRDEQNGIIWGGLPVHITLPDVDWGALCEIDPRTKPEFNWTSLNDEGMEAGTDVQGAWEDHLETLFTVTVETTLPSAIQAIAGTLLAKHQDANWVQYGQ